MSDEGRHDDDLPEDDLEGQSEDDHDGDEQNEGAEAPEPATWAGRQAWSGLPEDDEGQEDDDDEDAAEDEPQAETGLTEEFNALEQEFADDLDTELAGEHEIPEDQDPRADEGPDPADEFDFDEDGEGEADAEEPKEEPAGEGGETVEADTLALSDQEAAQEAALAGLRNRTAEHTAKRGVTDPGTASTKADAEAGDDADEAGEAEDEAAADKTEARPAAVAATAAPAEEAKPPRAGVWARFLAASFLIVASMAAATAVSILVYLTEIAEGLGGLPNLSNQLAEIDEEAQNFLILGSDVRADQSSKGLSDTTMLLRVDPDRGEITQLSIPRDLRVNIPGHGVDKFNAAYAYGGPKLTLQVVKQLTGERIPINHIVNVDFNGFADAVDAIGCVYVDVDHHYFNDNATAASLADQYAEIDIQAGYQRLCGYKALQYVRYRHADTDIVRAARQQGFLREARAKVPPSKLLEERDKLIDIFTDYTTSDIDDSGTLVELFKLMADARGAQITQIEFPVDSLDDAGYVTASDTALREAVGEFLGEPAGSGGNAPPAGEKPPKSGDGGDPKPGGRPEPPKDKPKPEPEPQPDPGQSPEQVAAAQMIDATASGQQYAAAIIEQGGKDLKFPVLYPTRIVPGLNASISDDSRYFGIDGGGGKLYHGYKFVMTMPGITYNPAYYGVSGTDWVSAPLFANPSEERKIGERTYKFFYDGGRLRMLAFERKGTMYWVTNTLDKLLTEPQMIAIAQNLSEAGS